MRKLAVAAMASALLVQPFCAVWGAGAAEDATARVMRRLEASQSQPADPLAFVTRTASIRVRGTINRKSPFALPVRCSVSFGQVAIIDSSSVIIHSESMSRLVTFSGNTGTCDITVPFKWANADSAEDVQASVDIATDDCVCAEGEIRRSSLVDFTAFPLPAENTVRLLGFNIDM